MTYKEYIEQLGIGNLDTIPKNSLSPIWRNNITRLNEQNFATLYSSLNNNFLNKVNPVIDAVNGLTYLNQYFVGQKYKFTYNNDTGKWEYELADSDSTSEIFNAYPPLKEEGKDIFNVATAEFTSASGKHTQSGSKAFLIKACDQKNKIFTLDSTEGLTARNGSTPGDLYSISASGYANVEDIAEIVEINGNVVKVDHLPVENGVGYGNAVPKSDALPENFPQGLAAPYFRITAKPNIGTQTIGEAASAFGKETIAEMDASFVTGRGSKSLGKYGVAMGSKNNTAYYAAAAIGGESNKAFGKNSGIIAGGSNQTNGWADFIAGGQRNTTTGGCAFAANSWNKALAFNAAAFGLYNESHGQNDFVTGYKNIVNGYCAAAFGLFHNIKGKGNFVTGQGSTAKEGAENCFITGQSNVAENAAGCFIAGQSNTVNGASAEKKILQGVILGSGNKVTGHYGVALGYKNIAGTQAFAAGVFNTANGWLRFAIGESLTVSNDRQVVVGTYNKSQNAAFIVGNGTSDTARSNAFVVNKDGSAEVGKQGTKDLSVATIKDLNEKVSSVYRYRGSVANKEALPTTGNVIGDVYNTEDSGMNYGWNGTTWDALGSEVDQSYNENSIKAQSGKAVAEAINGKQDTLVSGTNIKTINNQSILGSGNLEISGGSQITVDDALSATSTNPVQNKVINTEFNRRTPYLLSNLTFDVSTATPGWYYATSTVKFTNGKLANSTTTNYYTAAITNGNSVVFSVMHYNNRAVVELLHGGFFNYYNGASISQPKDNILILDYDDNKQLWYSTHYADLGTISEDYRAKDEINSNVAATTPTVELNQPSSEQNKNIVYQYANTLTSLTITATSSSGEYLTLDQSIRLIFKTTSSTTITVPSGLYFRGDDCNDSYVFIPQDNKVYDIIITYDGFNYNGIVVGTPATR